MRPNTLKPYGGALSLQEIANGMNAAAANSARLARDAQLLLKAESYATACSLAILAIEEAGKLAILRRLVTADANSYKKVWKAYRSHTDKNFLGLVPDLASAGGRLLPDFVDCFTESGLQQLETYDAINKLASTLTV